MTVREVRIEVEHDLFLNCFMELVFATFARGFLRTKQGAIRTDTELEVKVDDEQYDAEISSLMIGQGGPEEAYVTVYIYEGYEGVDEASHEPIEIHYVARVIIHADPINLIDSTLEVVPVVVETNGSTEAFKAAVDELRAILPR